MKKLTILLTAMLLVFAVSLNSCSDDAAEENTVVSELTGTWAWKTDIGQLSSAFNVEIIKQSDQKIQIKNFQNQGITVDVTVSGSTLSFSGSYGYLEIENGIGSITNNNSTITLDYDVKTSGESDTDHIKAILTTGGITAK